MRESNFNKTQVLKYLVWTFVPAYLIQAGVALLYQRGQYTVGRLVMTAMMFVPTLGVLLAGGKLKGLGWKPQLKRNLGPVLIAWFAPALLTALGAALYFLVFPGHFDLSGRAMLEAGGEEALAQLQAQGLSYGKYLLINTAAGLLYGPLINTFAALGEEIGWRGFLYPQLKTRYGRKKGWLLGGCIWGAWHWPLVWLIGYEYGTDYPGFPVTGMLLFCVITVAYGILCDRLYERGGSIWLPSLCHGAINAAAGLPLVLYYTTNGAFRLLGPAPNGLLAGLPFLLAAALLFLRAKEEPGTDA